MNSTEKRKYMSSIIMNMLSDHGFFVKNGSVWKLNRENEYVFNIQFFLGRSGDLNDIAVYFGSFFSPIKESSNRSLGLFLGNGIELNYYLRNSGIKKGLLQYGVPFESQVNEIMPYFNEIILPLIVSNNSLDEYLEKAWELSRMQIKSCTGIPSGVNVYEFISAYLAINMPQKSVAIAEEYASCCKYAAEHIRTNRDIYYYNNEMQVTEWMNSYYATIEIIKNIQNGNVKAILEDAKSKEHQSIETCKKYFRKHFDEST